MRHREPRNKLSKPYDQRRALLRSLATELLRHDEIVTTLSKAKALQPEAERLITIGKHGLTSEAHKAEKDKKGDETARKSVASNVHLRRQVAAYLYDKDVVSRVFNEIAPRYKDRQGGYTRILKAGFRRGDATPMAIIQLV